MALSVLAFVACSSGAAPATPTATPVVAAVTPTATLTPTPVPAPQPQKGGTYTILTSLTLSKIDPLYQGSGQEKNQTWPIYNSLIENDMPDHPNALVPGLAESWEIQDNGMTVVFRLRKGVKFHDGAELTSADVKYTFEAMNKPPAGEVAVEKVDLASIQEILTPDPYTVVLKLKVAGDNAFLEGMSYKLIVSQAAHQKAVIYRDTGNGTGPFKLTRFKDGEGAFYERNPSFWRPGLPYVDAMRIVHFSDKSAAIAAFAAKQGDYFLFPLGAADKPLLERYSEIKLWKLNRVNTTALRFSLGQPEYPWDDVRVRRAIGAALNRDEFIQTVLQGQGAKITFYPKSFNDGKYSLTQAEATQFGGYGSDPEADLALARRLLKEAGFENGFNATYTYSSDLIYDRDVGEWVASKLRPLNIIVKVEGLSRPDSAAREQQGLVQIGRGSILRASTDPTIFFNGFLKDSPANRNIKYYSPRFEQLYQEQRAAGPEERARLVREIDRLLMEDMPHVPLSQRVDLMAYWDHVKGFFMNDAWHYHVAQSQAWIWLDKR